MKHASIYGTVLLSAICLTSGAGWTSSQSDAALKMPPIQRVKDRTELTGPQVQALSAILSHGKSHRSLFVGVEIQSVEDGSIICEAIPRKGVGCTFLSEWLISTNGTVTRP